jgi:hypothetical protein
LHCSKGRFPLVSADLKEHKMTNLYLTKSLPITASDRIGEIFSAVTLVLSAVLALVAVVTLTTV